jgi:hypothetical protein
MHCLQFGYGMKLSKLLILFLFSLWQTSIHAEVYNYYGVAYDQKTGQIVYTDNHAENRRGEKHVSSEIVYKNPVGKVFAKKTISFEKKTTLPDFTLVDSRDGYIEGAKVTGNQIQLFYRENAKSEMQEKIFPIPSNGVVDGGFDQYIKENWDDILAGKKLNFVMFAPSKLNSYKFIVQKTKTGTYKEKQVVHLKIELDNLFGIFLPSIKIIYGIDNKRILFYEGISNINNPEGKSYFVKIQYYH